MNHRHRATRWLRVWVLAALAALAMACGGGGDGGSAGGTGTGAPPPDPDDDTGTVAVFLTDGPTDDFDQVLMTLSSIALLGDEGQEVIWTGEETFDLLDLESFRDLFAINDTVPVGIYDKLRLQISTLTLVRGEGDDAEEIPVKLPANGKVDLNPRGEFEVLTTGVLLIGMDIDANRSIHVVETGNGRYRFRPVIFVDVIAAPDQGKLMRLHGTVQDLDRDNGRFGLCLTEFVADMDGGDDDFAGDHCVDVATDGATSYFSGEDGAEVTLDQLNEGDETTVIGFFVLDDGADTPDLDESFNELFDLNAELLEIGPVGAFGMYAGLVAGAPDENNDFPFEPDPDQGFDPGAVATVETQDGTKVFSTQSEPLLITDVNEGESATVDAVRVEGDVLRSSLIVLDDTITEAELAGTIADIDAASRTFQLTTTDVEAGTACIFAPEDVEILEQPAEEGGEVTELVFEDLAVDRQVTVFGLGEEGQACISANVILVEPEAGGGGA